jgi:carboxyl-terminal processing protease
MLPTDPDTPRDAVADAAPAVDPPSDAAAPAAADTPAAGASAAPDGPAVDTTSPPRSRRRLRPVYLALALATLIGGSALFLSGYSLGARVATTPGTPAELQAAFAPFWDAYDAITQQFVGKVDRKQLVEGAIDGMVGSLGDQFTQYLTSEEYRQNLQGIAGRFEGIGAEIAARPASGGDAACAPLGPDCRLTVIAPIADSPAEKAGLKPGDVVAAIDAATVDGLTLDEAIAKVRGPKGTPVTLSIERDGAAPFDVTIVRDLIRRGEIQTRDLADGTVGYVKLAGFSDGSAADLERAIAEYARRGVKKIVLDLRGNGGGYVTAARSVASQFIGSGPIYWQENAKGDQVAAGAKPGGAATDPSFQVAVLIDGGSASASEIVAGALQDTGRGVLVGEKSFGKGTIQEWLPLPEDTGGMRLTIAKWLTPDKRWIHGTGLTPDVPVVPGSTGSGRDAALDRALEVLGVAADAATPPPSPAPVP